MYDVFISYSRKDAVFVRSLHDALRRSGRESWVDWEGIPPSSEWMAEIQRAIGAANTFVFVISPNSVKSEVCREELEYAEAQGKRIVPLIRIEPAAGTAPDAVARLNWIFLRAEDSFDDGFATLIEALETDLEHVRVHTRILVRAGAWTNHDEDTSHLLRGSDLETAEQWLQASQSKEPPVTPLQSRYLAESRRTQARRQRRLLVGVLAAVVVSVALGVVAFIQRDAAMEARDIAEQQRRLAVARALATESELAAGGDGESLVTATLLAIESLRTADTSEGKTAWQRRMALLPKAPFVQSVALGETRAGAFSNDLSHWAAGTEGGEVVLGLVRDGAVLTRWPAVNSPVRSLAFSPDGNLLAVGGEELITVWDLQSQVRLAEVTPKGSSLDTFGWVHDLVFSHDGSVLYAAAEGYGVEVISALTWQREEPLRYERSRVFALTQHPERDLLAAGGFGWWTVVPANGQFGDIPDQRREEIAAMRFSRSGYELAIADLAVRVWDVEPFDDGTIGAQPADRLIVTNDRVHDLDFGPSGRYLATSRDGMVQILAAKTGDEVQRIPAPGPMWRATFGSDDRTLLTVGERFSARHLHDAQQRYRRDFSANIREAYFVDDGRWLVTLNVQGQLVILQPDGLEQRLAIELGPRAMTTISPDGRWLAATGHDGLVVLNAGTMDELAFVPRASGPNPERVSFDPSSRYLLALIGQSAAVLNIELARWTDLVSANADSDEGLNGRFSEDGRWLALTSKNGVRLFQTDTWQAFPSVTQGKLVALGPDKELACTRTEAQRGRRSTMLHLWRLASGERIAWGPDPDGIRVSKVTQERGGDEALLRQCAEWPAFVWVSPVTGGPKRSARWTVTTEDASVMIDPLEVTDMIAEACARVPRNLGKDEWKKYLFEAPYRDTCQNLSFDSEARANQ